MIRVEEASPYQKSIQPWVFDRIEISGRVFIGPAKEGRNRADFERPTEEIRFSLVGAWNCEYQSGPNLLALATYCVSITGRGGFYGMASARRVD